MATGRWPTIFIGPDMITVFVLWILAWITATLILKG
jgi:hypothetical protein